MNDILQPFISSIRKGKVEVYNEFSLQHEVGIFLRQHFSAYKVQFERNIAYFEFNKNEFIKKEIDITIFSPDNRDLLYAIELKYPRNGQYPEQMFSFCKDIVFIEQLKKAGFINAAVLIIADDPLFYQGGDGGIYDYFRAGKTLTGKIQKPTGKKDSDLFIEGSYNIQWHHIIDSIKYAVVQ